jgi:hypothetical protein
MSTTGVSVRRSRYRECGTPDKQQVGPVEDMLELLNVLVTDVGVRADDVGCLEPKNLPQANSKAVPDVVNVRLERHPENADRLMTQVVPPLKP